MIFWIYSSTTLFITEIYEQNGNSPPFPVHIYISLSDEGSDLQDHNHIEDDFVACHVYISHMDNLLLEQKLAHNCRCKKFHCLCSRCVMNINTTGVCNWYPISHLRSSHPLQSLMISTFPLGQSLGEISTKGGQERQTSLFRMQMETPFFLTWFLGHNRSCGNS